MKIKEDFVLQEIAGEYIVVPIAKEADRLNGIIKLNKAGAFLWKLLAERELTGDELVESLKGSFSIDSMKAKDDVDNFMDVLMHLGCLE